MDTALALILPLIGGFLFVHRANFVKYEAAREDGHRFYFRVSYYGVGLFITSFVIFIFLDCLKSYFHFIADIRSWMVDAIGPMLKVPARAGAQVNLWFICLLCVVLGRTVPYILNRMWRKTALQALREAASKDALEALLIDSMEDRKTIAITTTMRKVYVGWPVGTAERTKCGAKISSHAAPYERAQRRKRRGSFHHSL